MSQGPDGGFIDWATPENRPDKPLGGKAYGSIPHLPGSRRGPGDHHADPGVARIACEKPRDRHDRIIVQEKLDGSCVAVARLEDEIVALGRAGWLAESSKYEQHQLFADWVQDHWAGFMGMLRNGDRAIGEWLAQAHGTRYELAGRDPWVMFDVVAGANLKSGYVPRLSTDDVTYLGEKFGFAVPPLICEGPTSIEDALRMLERDGHGWYGALDTVEGAVWRIERRDPRAGFRVDLVKYVRPDKVDGSFLPETTAGIAAGILEPVWNWRPTTG